MYKNSQKIREVSSKVNKRAQKNQRDKNDHILFNVNETTSPRQI